MTLSTVELILSALALFFGGSAAGTPLVQLLRKLLGVPANPLTPQPSPLAPTPLANPVTPVDTGHPLRDLLRRLLASPAFGHEEAIQAVGKLIAAETPPVPVEAK